MLRYALLCCIAALPIVAQSNEGIAQAFVPPAFTAYAASHRYQADHRQWSILPVDLDHTGHTDYLAIGYTNGHVGYLRVVRLGATPTLASESSPATACESVPSVEAIDLDGDGKPEIAMSCRVGNGGAQFSSIFRWQAPILVVLNPPNPKRPGAWLGLREPNYVDVDGDGTLEVLETSAAAAVDDAGTVTQTYELYRLASGKLVKASSGVTYFNQFTRTTGKPAAENETFTATPGTFVLTIVNGERGQHAVDSGVITLNGTTIASPSVFTNKARVMQTDVTLAAQNTLGVELRSAPESFLAILLTPKP